MWKQALAATVAALALSIDTPVEAGPLGKLPVVPRQVGGFSLSNRINIAGLNPQPLPPRWSSSNLLNLRALNPQPLPPRFIGGRVPLVTTPLFKPSLQPKITIIR